MRAGFEKFSSSDKVNLKINIKQMVKQVISFFELNIFLRVGVCIACISCLSSGAGAAAPAQGVAEKPAAPIAEAVAGSGVDMATRVDAPAPAAPAPVPVPVQLDRDQACARIGNKLGSVSVQDCLASGLEPSGHYSVNGVPILVKEYPPLPGVKPQARVLLLGGIHGDEFSAVSIVFKWMKVLDANHSGLFHWRLTPLANPDGLLQKKAQRMNARGIDLNRNFPTLDWVKESLAYWMTRTGRDPRRYPGVEAASEPETRWVLDEIARFKPDVIISLHAPYGLLDFDGPAKIPPKQVGHLYLEQLGSFPGSLGRYGWATENIPVVTIELPYSGIMPSPKEQMSIWTDMVGWLKRHAGKVSHEALLQTAAVPAPTPVPAPAVPALPSSPPSPP